MKDTIPKIEVLLQDGKELDITVPEEARWIACINNMPGCVEVAKTKQQAFDELMLSLIVKIIHDNNLSDIEPSFKINKP